MAHGITETDKMIYVGELPWHKLGIPLPGLATAQEVKDALQMYRVEKRPVYTMYPNGSYVQVPEKFATVRMDNNHALGIVGSQYTVLQNEDALSLLDDITIDPRGPKYETAGTLWEGRQFWALARMPEWSEIIPNDLIGQYLLISNSHDGSRAINVQMTPVRVVCNNTLTAAVNSAQRYLKIRHSGNVFHKISNVQDALGLITNTFQETTNLYKALADTNPTVLQINEVLEALFPQEKTKSQRNKLQAERVLNLAENGIGSDVTGHKLTGWTLYNGVTELIDHHNNKNSKSDDADSMRLNSMWYGSGAKVKDDALSTISKVLLSV